MPPGNAQPPAYNTARPATTGNNAGNRIMEPRFDSWGPAPRSHNDLHLAYMRDVGIYHLLSPEEEARWARQYSEARAHIKALIQRFPQVILAKLEELRQRPQNSPQGLDSYIALENQDEEPDLPPKRDSTPLPVQHLLERLLNDSDSLLKQLSQADGTSLDDFASVLSSYLEEAGRVHFQQRFFLECVNLFIQGNWKAPGLSDAERQRLSAEMKETSRQADEAMNRLVEGNLRLVISIARRYACSLIPLADLVQEGNIGLMRAVESFEYRLGHRFSTYASYWIRQSISRALNSYGRSIRMPVNILRHLSKIHRAECVFLQENGTLPTIEQLSELVGLPAPRIRALQKMGQQPISLQSIATEDRDWSELLADDRPQRPADELNHDAIQKSLQLALGTLDERSREILVRRFGLMGHSVETLEQIAQRFHLTSERIRQLEAIALRKLRQPESNRYLEDLRMS